MGTLSPEITASNVNLKHSKLSERYSNQRVSLDSNNLNSDHIKIEVRKCDSPKENNKK